VNFCNLVSLGGLASFGLAARIFGPDRQRPVMNTRRYPGRPDLLFWILLLAPITPIGAQVTDSIRADTDRIAPPAWNVDTYPYVLSQEEMVIPDTLTLTSDHYIICQALIDTLGHPRNVIALGCEGEKDALCLYLTRRLLDVRFAPASWNGQPVEAPVVFSVTVRAAPERQARLGVPVVDRWEEGRCRYGERIYGSGELSPTERPSVRQGTAPSYPPAAAADSLKGRVDLRLIVDPDGVPCFVLCDRAQPAGRGFVESAVNAVRRWRFVPGHLGGEPQAVWLELPFSWSP